MEPDKLRSYMCLTGMKECKDIAATEIGPKSDDQGPAKSEHASNFNASLKCKSSGLNKLG